MFADDEAKTLLGILHKQQRRIVFAESCTAGLIAATCARIPGASEVLVGSSVVYQAETKTCWLSVSRSSLETHGAVSRIVSEEMAQGVLRVTPHADIGVSISGHLGPGAPDRLDGVAWCCLATRESNGINTRAIRFQLSIDAAELSQIEKSGASLRHSRQFEATRLVLEFCIQSLGDRILEK